MNPESAAAQQDELVAQLHTALDRVQSTLELHLFLRAAPFLAGCFVTLACLAALWITWRRQAQHLEQLVTASRLSHATPTSLQAALKDALPAWVMHPDYARSEWINDLIAQMWPLIDRVAGKMDDKLEALLNGTAFWRPRVLLDAELQVLGVSLGHEPPRVTGAKTFSQAGLKHGEVLMEYSFVWASKMECKLLLNLLGKRQGAGGLLGLLSSVTRLKVGVAHLVARGTLRISLKPLMEELPLVGGVKFSFVGTPDFSYQTRILGGNPYLVPGLKHWVDSFIRKRLLTPLQYPDGFIYNLASRSVTVQERPEGLLEVTVIEATGVPRMDLLGKSDPYCQLWLREGVKLRSTVKSRTLHPVWRESYTLMVHSSLHQNLNLELYDSDFWSEDDLIGHVTVPLSRLDLTPGAVNDLWLPVPRASRRRGGAPETSVHDSQQAWVHTVTPAVAGDSAAWLDPSEVDGPPIGQAAAQRSLSAMPVRASRSAQKPEASSSGQTPLPRRSPGARDLLRATSSTSLGSAWSQQLVELAASPLALLRSKRCMLHISVAFFPLSDQEIAAVVEQACGQQSEQQAAAPAAVGVAPSSTLSSVPRMANILRSGILYIFVDRADNLPNKGGVLTRNLQIDVRVGTIQKTTERGKLLRNSTSPSFDETVELIIDAKTAARTNTLIHVEMYRKRFYRRANFLGRVSLPLRDVIERRQVRDTWPLQDAQHGSLTMELRWLSALAM